MELPHLPSQDNLIMSWQTRKKPPRQRDSALPLNLEREVYAFICERVPFLKTKEVVAHFSAQYNYSRQHIYLIISRLADKGWVKYSMYGDLTLQRYAPVIWGAVQDAGAESDVATDVDAALTVRAKGKRGGALRYDSATRARSSLMQPAAQPTSE